MSGNKWNWTEPDSGKASYAKTERGGMIAVFCLGLLFFVGGLLFVWAIGAFDDEYFFGYKVHHFSGKYHKTERTILGLLHLPWFAGAWMMIASGRYFWRNRKKNLK